jgi:NTE family protein
MTRKKVGLALSGGAARGFAHLGVLEVLMDNSIPIDLVSGTSAGSIAAGAYAAGMTAEQMLEMARKVAWTNMGSFSFSAKGLINSAPMGDFLRKHIPITEIENLKVPFAAVATNLETADEVVFKDHGDLIFAIRASCALPGVFVPLEDDKGQMLIDGGAVAPLPTKVLRKMGAEVIIGVDLIFAGPRFTTPPQTLLGVFFQAAMVMLRTASKHHHHRADIVIAPKIAHIRPDEIGKREELIDLGRQAALEKIDEIKALIG